MAGREKGTETLPCPTCRTQRPIEVQADGSKTAPACPKCYPAESVTPEVASATPPAREVGTPVIVEGDQS